MLLTSVHDLPQGRNHRAAEIAEARFINEHLRRERALSFSADLLASSLAI